MVEKETLFERLAKINNISVEELRAQIEAQIKGGLNDPDPVRQAQWKKIPCAGEIPTPEEWLHYAVERLNNNGADDLLKRYLIDG